MPSSYKYAQDMPSTLPRGRVRFDKEEVLWWRLVRGRRKCHYQGGSVSFIIVLGNARRGVIIIVIADRAVGGRSKQVY